jgi:Tfp pilus assembly protein PilW
MVEMLVALVFTMVLMAGMATVFKASLSTLFTSGEALSNVRRNRLSVDLLGQDLDTACMTLDMTTPPPYSDTCPDFYVLPNMPITGVPASPAVGDPTSADQLYFYVDQPLPFQATLHTGFLGPVHLPSLTFDCAGSATYAGMVASGQFFVLQDAYEVGAIGTTTVTGSQVVVQTVAATNPNGYDPTGDFIHNHMATSNVLIYQPAQMVRYSVQYLMLNPNASDGNLIPCLVRDQGNYSTSGFTATQPQQIITENVTGFKVYLSVSPNLVATNDAGAWAGSPTTQGSGFTDMAGWNSLLLGTTSPQAASITTQLAAKAPNAIAPASDPYWFRDNPVLVRVDLTTRTAAQRTEYIGVNNASAATGAAYKLLTQSLIFVPRHSGLPIGQPAS